MTSKPVKEVVTVLVDNVDADLSFAAMAQAGQVERRDVARHEIPHAGGLAHGSSLLAGASWCTGILSGGPDVLLEPDWEQGPRQLRGVVSTTRSEPRDPE